ncbi:MAG: antibiotic biosynthesis monooxygenase family protein [Candidatus Bathyarchaeia archaeon]
MSDNLGGRWVRFVSASVPQDKQQELKKTYGSIMRRIKMQKGLRRIYLLAEEGNPEKIISATFWNTQRDASAYVKSGAYNRNLATVRDLVTGKAAVTEYRVLMHDVGATVKPARKAKRGRKR